jgi:hypothetical protein
VIRLNGQPLARIVNRDRLRLPPVRHRILAATEIGHEYTVIDVLVRTRTANPGVEILESAVRNQVATLASLGRFDRVGTYTGGRGHVTQRYRRVK